jgi:hypothetical protein
MADVDAQGEIRTCAAEVDERFSQLAAVSVGNGVVSLVGLCARVNDARRRDGDQSTLSHIVRTQLWSSLRLMVLINLISN